MRLGELLNVQNGYAFSSKDYSKSGHFVMRIGNVQNGIISVADPKFINLPPDGKLDRFILSEGDILVSLTGNVGRVGVIEKEHIPAVLNQRVAKLTVRNNSPVAKDFLLLFLLGDWFRDELTSAGHGAAQQNVSTKDLVEIRLPIPPLPEQQRIVGILDRAFDGIATAKANAEKNLQNARALFESYLKSAFAQRDPESINVGWYNTKLAELASVQSGAGFPIAAQGKVQGGIPFYKVSDMNIVGNERSMIYENNSITEAVRRQLKAFKFPEGSVIFPKIGGAIATNKKRLTTRECCVDNNVMGVIPKAEKIDSEFLYFFFLGRNLSEFANEAHLPSIKKSVVEDWGICVPETLAEQRIVVGKLEELSSETQKLESLYQRKLVAIEALKKSLLHQAFTGAL